MAAVLVAAHLCRSEAEILRVLDERGGYSTGQVARLVGSRTNMRKHSAMTRQWLLQLEVRGLVRRLDADKPVVWGRTPAGTEVLEAAA